MFAPNKGLLKVEGFEEKESQGEKKHEAIQSRAKAQFPQEGPDLSGRTAGNALPGFPRPEEIVKEEAGSDNQKNLDGQALGQFFRRYDNGSSKGKTEKDIRGDRQVGELIRGKFAFY